MFKNLRFYYLYTFLINSRYSRGILMLYSLGFGITPLEFGLLQTLYNLVRMISEVPTGMLADRISKKYILSIGAFLNALSALGLLILSAYSLQSPFGILMILFACDSLGTVFSSGADQALLYESMKSNGQENLYVNYLGNMQILSILTLSLTTALGGTLYQRAYSIVFLFEVILFLLASLVILFFQSPEGEPLKVTQKLSFQKSSKETCGTFKQYPMVGILILFLTMFEVYLNALVRFIQGALADVGMSTSLIALVVGATTFFGIFGAYTSRFCKTTKPVYFFSSFISLFLISTIFLSLKYPLLMVIGFTCLNILWDILFPYISYHLNQLVSDNVRSTILSVYSSLVGFFSLFFYPLTGAMMGYLTYSATFFTIGIGITLIFLMLLHQLYRLPSKLNNGSAKDSATKHQT